MIEDIQRAALAIDDADFVLIGAGAGMSAAAGVDYTDEASFAALFPAFRNIGMKARYQAIGFNRWPPEVHWGYWAIHVSDIRFGPRHDKPYSDLLALVQGKDYFVYTSNVDMLFPRNGFDEAHLYTPQGDYGYLQCVQACRQEVYPSEPTISALMQAIDPVSQVVTDKSRIPACPHCGGRMFLNVRVDRNFVEVAYLEQRRRMIDWLGRARQGKLVVIEIGAGFNTPSVIRWPCESIVAETDGSTLIRINRDHAEIPEDVRTRAISLASGADVVLRSLYAFRQGAGSSSDEVGLR